MAAATLDAANLSTREINTRLKSLADEGREVTVQNPRARHNLGVGILKPAKITFDGSVGRYCAAYCDGVDVTINGNADWGLASNLMNGRVVLKRNAGMSVASSIHAGDVFVGGNAGARAGIGMKGGQLIIAGDAGFATGFLMQKGRIIVCGNAGEATADSMYEGIVYVGGKIAALGNDSKIETITEPELQSINDTLRKYGVEERRNFTKIVSAKKLYHYDALEPLEQERMLI
jgi:glutamate synthase domain-containing protein 3